MLRSQDLPSLGAFPGTFFISHHPSSTSPITPGDIKVFKDMPLTSLSMSDCGLPYMELTGACVWVECVGLGWWGQDQ